MNKKVLAALSGVLHQMDKVLIFSKDILEHDTRLEQVLQRIRATSFTLNQQKCQFHKPSLKFLGYLADATGILPDLHKA